jgi:hypothetical protein
VVHAAVSNAVGVCTMTRSDNPNYPCASMADTGGATFDVQTLTLDDYLPPFDGPTTIKMDIEGAEVLALEGMRRLLSTGLAELLFEIHPELIARLRRNGLRQMEALLAEFDYQIATCDLDRVVPSGQLVGSRVYAAPRVPFDQPPTMPDMARVLWLRAKRAARERLRGY